MLEVIPRLIRSPSHTPFTFGISVEPKNKCYLVFALSMNMIGSCLLQYGYSFKSKNNCCSMYMNKTFYCHTLKINGLLNLDVVIHIFIILMPKDEKLIMIEQHICGTAV